MTFFNETKCYLIKFYYFVEKLIKITKNEKVCDYTINSSLVVQLLYIEDHSLVTRRKKFEFFEEKYDNKFPLLP